MGRESVWAAGAARGGPGWADGGSCCSFYSSSNREALKEWIDDLHAIDDLPVLHILGEQYATAG